MAPSENPEQYLLSHNEVVLTSDVSEDEVIENLLSKYDSLSDHIQVVKKNPDVYPTFAEQYTDETVMNNSLIVECGDRSRYIGYDDIYLQDMDLSSYYNVSYSFDGEGAITSAIDYVVSEDFPQLYILEGHGEQELPASFRDQIEKENIETHTLSLLTVDEIPEDADCLMIYAPASDISQEEKDLLADYTAGGGKLFVAARPLSLRTRRTSASTAWTTPSAPSNCPQRNGTTRSSWGTTARWTPSGMSPSGTGTSI